MKRSKVIEILASWAEPEILQDVYANNTKEWADNLLHVLENEVQMQPSSYTRVLGTDVDGVKSGEAVLIKNAWEPEDET